mmetsp:Transcript_35173/g.51657  ORF Transcript_35173/g.51657 Transcript_35173/m.51657 type:complete len:103 (-) Transcript_35173:178-486(-)
MRSATFSYFGCDENVHYQYFCSLFGPARIFLHSIVLPHYAKQELVNQKRILHGKCLKLEQAPSHLLMSNNRVGRKSGLLRKIKLEDVQMVVCIAFTNFRASP